MQKSEKRTVTRSEPHDGDTHSAHGGPPPPLGRALTLARVITLILNKVIKPMK